MILTIQDIKKKFESCNYCQKVYGSYYRNNRGNYVELVKTKDHVYPKSRFKQTSIIHCCQRCNSFKGDRTLREWYNLISDYLKRCELSPDGSTKKRPGEPGSLNQYKHSELNIILQSIRNLTRV